MTATQVKHPWRSTARTVFAVALGVISVVPDVVTTAHVDHTFAGAQAIVVAGAVTRVLALPSVERFLQRYAPVLAAVPPTS